MHDTMGSAANQKIGTIWSRWTLWLISKYIQILWLLTFYKLVFTFLAISTILNVLDNINQILKALRTFLLPTECLIDLWLSCELLLIEIFEAFRPLAFVVSKPKTQIFLLKFWNFPTLLIVQRVAQGVLGMRNLQLITAFAFFNMLSFSSWDFVRRLSFRKISVVSLDRVFFDPVVVTLNSDLYLPQISEKLEIKLIFKTNDLTVLEEDLWSRQWLLEGFLDFPYFPLLPSILFVTQLVWPYSAVLSAKSKSEEWIFLTYNLSWYLVQFLILQKKLILTIFWISWFLCSLRPLQINSMFLWNSLVKPLL